MSQCGQAFRDLAESVTGTDKSTTTTLAPTTIPTSDDGSCDSCFGAEWDAQCHYGGIG